MKVFLHLGDEELRRRMPKWLDDPAERWTSDPGDMGERAVRVRVPAGVRGGPGALLDRGGAVVRRARRPEVVPRPGRRRAAAGPLGGDGSALSAGGLRRRRRRRGAPCAAAEELGPAGRAGESPRRTRGATIRQSDRHIFCGRDPFCAQCGGRGRPRRRPVRRPFRLRGRRRRFRCRRPGPSG
ncbi:hypothetical protein EF903_31850, partial [Streptomyces sp. WAC05292]